MWRKGNIGWWSPAPWPVVTYLWTTTPFPSFAELLPMLGSRFILLALFVTVSVTAEEVPITPVARSVAHRRAEERGSGDRQREGTRLTDISGRFEVAGDRVTFFPTAGRESYRLLENLSLERVAQVLSESRSRQEWTVSGTLTEFRGANYLLLTKAVIRAQSEAK